MAGGERSKSGQRVFRSEIKNQILFARGRLLDANIRPDGYRVLMFSRGGFFEGLIHDYAERTVSAVLLGVAYRRDRWADHLHRWRAGIRILGCADRLHRARGWLHDEAYIKEAPRQALEVARRGLGLVSTATACDLAGGMNSSTSHLRRVRLPEAAFMGLDAKSVLR